MDSSENVRAKGCGMVVLFVILALLFAAIWDYVSPWLALSLLVIFGSLVFFLSMCLVRIGDKKRTLQAVRLIGGDPGNPKGDANNVVGPGFHLKIPFVHEFKLFPTGRVILRYALSPVTKAEGPFASVPMQVEVTISFRFAQWDEEYDDPEGGQGARINGRNLLIRSTLALSDQDPLNDAHLKGFLGESVAAAVWVAYAQRTYMGCIEQRADMEAGMKAHLFAEQGNPFRDAGIPQVSINLAITQNLPPQNILDALSKLEIAERGVAAKKVDLETMIACLKDAGVEPLDAAIIYGNGDVRLDTNKIASAIGLTAAIRLFNLISSLGSSSGGTPSGGAPAETP